MSTKSPRFAIVMHPGTPAQVVDAYAQTLLEAIELAAALRKSDVVVDVMRINSDGSLTTEF